MPAVAVPQCPLCGDRQSEVEPVQRDARAYFRCRVCALIHLDPAQRPSITEERARYERHRNDGADPGYVGFLRTLADPMIERLPAGARGLDFGCGPAPVLAALFTAAGFPCAAYDPCFAPDGSLLEARYDFIACCEVAEHLHAPGAEFARLQRLLTDSGLLGVMTHFHDDAVPFHTWWYRRDITHVCFYGERTMEWIAREHAWTLTIVRPNVALFERRKP